MEKQNIELAYEEIVDIIVEKYKLSFPEVFYLLRFIEMELVDELREIKNQQREKNIAIQKRPYYCG